MKYYKGFEYQLAENEYYQSNIRGYSIDKKYYSLNEEGLLCAKVGFAWDGCSGSKDTDTNMRAGLFHDIGCLMVARGELPRHCLDDVNKMFYMILDEDGMWSMRRWWHFEAVTMHFANGKMPDRRKLIVLEKP